MKNVCFAFALLLLVGASLFTGSTATAQTVIADFYNDFAQPANTGWSYLWNPTGVAIGDDANYVAIPGVSASQYNERTATAAVGTQGDTGNFLKFFLTGTNMRIVGGFDAGVASADGGDGLDHYAIARYTVQPGEAGNVTFDSSNINLQRNAGNSIAAYKNNVLVDTFALDPGATVFTVPVSLDFGTVAEGDTLDLAFLTPDNGATRNQRRMFVGEAATHVFTSTPVTGGLLGDIDLDGSVTFLDIAPFIAILASGGFQTEADINLSGDVTFLDIQPFIDILANP